jgi:hypothetical protein
MRAVTEFANVTLTQALKARAALAADGKTPEEIQESLASTYKLEGDKLTHFINALVVAEKNSDGLKRVLVMSLNEGEKAPAKSVQVEAHHYVPEFHIDPKTMQKKADSKNDRNGRGGRGGAGGKGKGGGKGKESPYGLSPEEKAAKKGPASKTK